MTHPGSEVDERPALPTLDNPEAYVAEDRRRALATGRDLPQRTAGTALFADISGFTPLTEALVAQLGALRGAEELSRILLRLARVPLAVGLRRLGLGKDVGGPVVLDVLALADTAARSLVVAAQHPPRHRRSVSAGRHKRLSPADARQNRAGRSSRPCGRGRCAGCRAASPARSRPRPR